MDFVVEFTLFRKPRRVVDRYWYCKECGLKIRLKENKVERLKRVMRQVKNKEGFIIKLGHLGWGWKRFVVINKKCPYCGGTLVRSVRRFKGTIQQSRPWCIECFRELEG